MRIAPHPVRRRPLEEIEKILVEFRASGLSQQRFALLHGINPVTLGYWIRRALRQTALVAPRTLVPVRIKLSECPATEVSSAFEVILRSRRILRVSRDFDAEALRRLVTILDDGC
jgi:transposase-like protein